jgi:uncharacterized membrane protein YphA (DoxX/SURF4 family)
VLSILILCRSIVAITFLLSAAWKLRNPAEFQLAISGRLPMFHGKVRERIPQIVAGVELCLGLALLLDLRSWFIGLLGVVFLIGFSAFLARAGSLINGCGCWRPVRHGPTSARFFLARNLLLIILAGAGSFVARGASAGAELAIVAAALIPSWLVMEIPGIAALLSAPERRPRPINLGGKV